MPRAKKPLKKEEEVVSDFEENHKKELARKAEEKKQLEKEEENLPPEDEKNEPSRGREEEKGKSILDQIESYLSDPEDERSPSPKPRRKYHPRKLSTHDSRRDREPSIDRSRSRSRRPARKPKKKDEGLFSPENMKTLGFLALGIGGLYFMNQPATPTPTPA